MEWLFIALGILGGFARSLYGVFKSLNRREEMQKGIFILDVIVAGILGGVMGQFIGLDYHISALAGYVGPDLLHNFIDVAVPKSITIKK